MNENKITLQVHCRCCGKEVPVSVDLEDLGAWQRGEKLVQDAFPISFSAKKRIIIN